MFSPVDFVCHNWIDNLRTQAFQCFLSRQQLHHIYRMISEMILHSKDSFNTVQAPKDKLDAKPS